MRLAPITFVNPGLLAGAAAAAVPILLHLWQRRPPRRLPFSDLRFLEESQAHRARRLGLRRWLLLLLRVLAILCVVVAVARPRLAGLASTPGGALSVVFLIDASASMQTQQAEGDRFAAAKDLCTGLTTVLPAGSEVQVVVGGDGATPLFAEWQPAAALDRAAVAAAAASDGGFDLAAALREAARWSATARHTPAEIIVLSDLQLADIDTARLGAAVRSLAEAGAPRIMVRRVGEEVRGGGVLGVRLPTRGLRPGETIRITAEVRLEHADEVVALEVSGQRVAEAVATGGGGEIQLAEFTAAAPAAGRHRCRIVKRSDRFTLDDELPFVLHVRDNIQTLLVHGPDRGETAGRGGWRFVGAALDPEWVEGEGSSSAGNGAAAQRRSGSQFAVRALASDRLTDGDLAAAEVVLVVDPEPWQRAQLAALEAWLEAGGGAVFWLGEIGLVEYLTASLLPALGLIGPAEPRARADEARERVRLSEPVPALLADLGTEPLATLEEVRWRRFLALPEGGGQTLLEFSGGAPALIAGRRGNGSFYLFPFSLTLEASELAVSPIFLPLVQRLAASLVGGGEHRGGGVIRVGDPLSLRVGREESSRGLLADPAAWRVLGPGGLAGARGPAGPDEIVGARLIWTDGVPWLSAGLCARRGFYTFLAGRDTLGVVAAAISRAESELRLSEAEPWLATLASLGYREGVDLGGIEPADFAAALGGQELSAWFLILACVVLLVEAAVARRAGGSRPAV